MRRPQSRTMALPPGRACRIDVIDTWTMTVDPVPGTHTGTVRIDLPGREFMAVRIIPETAAEPLPEPADTEWP
ncbi:DUF5605 domain-containing protein [Streptodolium elevatio]